MLFVNTHISEATCIDFFAISSAVMLVSINTLVNKDILKYIDIYKPYDKAGSYGIQDSFSVHINKITGCFYNVMGLPISKFHRNFILAKKEITIIDNN